MKRLKSPAQRKAYDGSALFVLRGAGPPRIGRRVTCPATPETPFQICQRFVTLIVTDHEFSIYPTSPSNADRMARLVRNQYIHRDRRTGFYGRIGYVNCDEQRLFSCLWGWRNLTGSVILRDRCAAERQHQSERQSPVFHVRTPFLRRVTRKSRKTLLIPSK